MQSPVIHKPALQSNLLIKNSNALKYNKNGATFLSEAPRGAYTTMRTIDHHTKILQFDIQSHRLGKMKNPIFFYKTANSCKIMIMEECKEIPQEFQVLVNPQTLGKIMMRELYFARSVFMNMGLILESELRIYQLVTWDCVRK